MAMDDGTNVQITDAGAGGATGDGGAPPALPDWLAGLPEADRADDGFVKRVSAYKTPLDLAKALTETQEWARARISLPKEGDPASRAEFYAKVRPESADKYEFDVPTGGDPALADKFKAHAFANGLDGEQAKAQVQFWNQTMSDAISLQNQQGADQLKALELEMGLPAFTQRVEGTETMLRTLGIEVESLAPVLEQMAGDAGKAMRALFTLAERTGELPKVDGNTVDMRMGIATKEQIAETKNRYMNDKDFMAKAQTPGTDEHRKWKALSAAEARLISS
jgi:hypothetical protein